LEFFQNNFSFSAGADASSVPINYGGTLDLNAADIISVNGTGSLGLDGK
jgi:hypothetical protein